MPITNSPNELVLATFVPARATSIEHLERLHSCSTTDSVAGRLARAASVPVVGRVLVLEILLVNFLVLLLASEHSQCFREQALILFVVRVLLGMRSCSREIVGAVVSATVAGASGLAEALALLLALGVRAFLASVIGLVTEAAATIAALLLVSTIAALLTPVCATLLASVSTTLLLTSTIAGLLLLASVPALLATKGVVAAAGSARWVSTAVTSISSSAALEFVATTELLIIAAVALVPVTLVTATGASVVVVVVRHCYWHLSQWTELVASLLSVDHLR